VVYTKWNQYYVDELKKAALGQFEKSGANYVTLEVPGACELVNGTRAMIRKSKPDAIIVLGVLIKGSSDVYEATCNSVMHGLTELNASQDVPVTVGLLMCRDDDQAHERSHGASNPARAWAETALYMAALPWMQKILILQVYLSFHRFVLSPYQCLYFGSSASLLMSERACLDRCSNLVFFRAPRVCLSGLHGIKNGVIMDCTGHPAFTSMLRLADLTFVSCMCFFARQEFVHLACTPSKMASSWTALDSQLLRPC